MFLFWANLLVQEVTQLANESGQSFWGKLVQHFKYSKYSTSFIFNYVDFVLVLTSVSAFIFRMAVFGSLGQGQLADPLTSYILHNLYIFNFMTYTIRMLQVYEHFSGKDTFSFLLFPTSNFWDHCPKSRLVQIWFIKCMIYIWHNIS